MKRMLIALSATIVTTAIAGLGAQDKGKAASFTGCVESGSTAGTYILTQAMPASAEKASGIAGALGGNRMKEKSDTAGKMMETPLLLTGNTAELTKHLGHKITVKGTLTGDANKMVEEGAKTGANKIGGRLGSRLGKAGEKTNEQVPSGQVGPTLEIESFSMVASSCS